MKKLNLKSIGSKIFFSFILIILIFAASLSFIYSDLSDVKDLTDKVIPYNLQMVALQDFSNNLNSFEKATDQYLVVLNYENQVKAEDSITGMNRAISKISENDDGGLSETTSKLERDTNELSKKFEEIVNTDKNSGSNNMNILIIGIYDKISELKEIQKITMDKNQQLVEENSNLQKQIISSVVNKFILTGIIILIIGVGLSLLLANKIQKPIVSLTKAGNEIAEGKFDTKVPQVNTGDELEALSETMELLVGAIRFHTKDKKSKK